MTNIKLYFLAFQVKQLYSGKKYFLNNALDETESKTQGWAALCSLYYNISPNKDSVIHFTISVFDWFVQELQPKITFHIESARL